MDVDFELCTTIQHVYCDMDGYVFVSSLPDHDGRLSENAAI